MAAWYYVMSDGANDGTATADKGRYTSEQTGAISAAKSSDWGAKGHGTLEEYYYPSMAAAMAATTTPEPGDFIRCTDTHNFTESGVQTWTITHTAHTDVLSIISVDAANVDKSKLGAEEGGSTTNVFVGSFYFQGMTIAHTSWFYTNANASQVTLEDCAITGTTSNGYIWPRNNYSKFKLINTAVTASNFFFSISGSGFNAVLEMTGGSLTDSGTSAAMFLASNTNIQAYFEDVDMGNVEVSDYLIKDIGNNFNIDGQLAIQFRNCKTSALTGFANEAFSAVNRTLSLRGCSDNSNAAEHQLFELGISGQVEDDSGIFRNQDTAYSSGDKISLKVTSLSTCSIYLPIAFIIPSRFCELSDTSKDELRIYFASSATLTNTNVWGNLYYPDGSTKQLWNFISNRNADILATGTTHSTDGTSTWTGAGGLTLYTMTIPTSGDVGADSVPVLELFVGIASATIYFGSEFDLE